MADKTILSLIPGFDGAMKSAGEALGGIYPSFLGGKTELNTTSIVLLCFVFVFLLGLAFKARSRMIDTDAAVIPDDKLTARTVVEMLMDAVFGLMNDTMGRQNAKRFFPLIATCAFIILFSNLFGLMPGFAPPTDNFNLNIVMASVIFLATHIVGVQTNGIHHFGHMANPIGEWWGWFLAPPMFLIEVVSHFVRPLSLALRLMANMIGDHKVLVIFLTLVGIPIVYPVPIVVLGIIVCVVQAAVFCLLSIVYISLSLEDLTHHEEHGH
jgi:F-type H+-transporting ATPase subunit a